MLAEDTVELRLGIPSSYWPTGTVCIYIDPEQLINKPWKISDRVDGRETCSKSA